jgi:hypothetical protein
MIPSLTAVRHPRTVRKVRASPATDHVFSSTVLRYSERAALRDSRRFEDVPVRFFSPVYHPAVLPTVLVRFALRSTGNTNRLHISVLCCTQVIVRARAARIIGGPPATLSTLSTGSLYLKTYWKYLENF